MTFNDAARYLRLINEMPGSAAMNWKLEELFQRDIDWPRVEKKIVPYLRKQTEPQFFNSLTIALLPIRNDALAPFDGSATWHAPTLDTADQFSPGTVRSYGPITCGYWGNWENPGEDNARLGQICWNTDEICGVAIDGQHRLAAIKHLVGPGSDTHRQSSVPVILIVLDEALGFNRGTEQHVLVDTLRSLFIDLNKHAEKVKRARQILLDDRDPASVCVRTLVGSELTSGRAELDSDDPVLPLSLVDWHSEQAKFDEGPYLTTILGLDWAIAKALGIRPFEDPMAFETTSKLLTKLERKLNVSLDSARTRLDECRRYERPFSFVEEPEDELSLIGNGFRDRWSRPLLHLFTEFRPYRELISMRQTLGTLSPEFANWFALKESADNAGGGGKASQLLEEIESFLSSREQDPIAIEDFRNALQSFATLKQERELAFTVVFQRSMILAFLQFTTVSGGMVDSLSASSEVDLEGYLGDEADGELEEEESGEEIQVNAHEVERARDLVAGLNHAVEQDPDILLKMCEFPSDAASGHRDRFWLCSFARPEGQIDFSQSASQRASDILLLIGLFWIYRTHENLGEDDFDALMDRAEEATQGIDLKLQQCLGRMWSGSYSIASRILNSRDQDDTDEDLLWQEIHGRASWLWSLICQ
jgi:DGQHR domain-containing protein